MPRTGGYAWLLARRRRPGRHQPLLRPRLRAAGLCQGAEGRASTRPRPSRRDLDLLERHFWRRPTAFTATRPAPTGSVSPYRGQNANMHRCEAMLAAFEATGERRYLERAERLARPRHHRPGRQGRRAGVGALRRRLERRLGLQPGRSQAPVPALGLPARAPDRMGQAAADPRAPPRRVRVAAADRAASVRHRDGSGPGTPSIGGICYGFAPDGSVCDGDKYFWVQAECFAAAALLAARTGESATGTGTTGSGRTAGATWSTTSTAPGIRILIAATSKYSDEKSPAGKTDYHTMGACYEVLNVVRG